MLSKESIKTVEGVIGYTFKDKKLLSQAFIRSSYSYEHPEDQDNELLELLGDTVLSTVVTAYLFDRYVNKDGSGLYSSYSEGELSAIRSNLVNKSFLAKRIRALDIGYMLKMGMSDTEPVITQSKSIYEDLFESIVGAVFLDTNRNFLKTSPIVCNMLNIKNELDEFDGVIRISYKNELQEWCQKDHISLPVYDTHELNDGFESLCSIDLPIQSSRGQGHTKKDAENDAAKNMLNFLDTYILPDADKYDLKVENAINLLQEFCMEEKVNLPEYELISNTVNKDNTHEFVVRCYLDDYNYYYDGIGTTKKDAKKRAAFGVLKRLI